MMVPGSKRTFGEVPEDFRQFVIQAAQKEEKPMRIKRRVAVLVAVLLIFVLACSAVAAIGINRSAQNQAAQQAKALLQQQYGLTSQSLGMFSQSIREDADGYVVRFNPFEFETRMGVYTVHIPPDGAASASWTHDGTDLEALAAMGPEAEVWGRAQIERIMALKTERREAVQATLDRLGAPEGWTIAEWAELDAAFVDVPGYTEAYAVHVLPGADDITPEEAQVRMLAAVEERYGVSQAQLSTYRSELTFIQYPGADTPHYVLWLGDPVAMEMNATNAFHVTMESASGKIAQCDWAVSADYASLPDGPLDAYEEAVHTYVNSGAFDRITDETLRQQTAERIIAAGFGDLIRWTQYSVPDADSLTRDEALAAAADAIAQAYQLTDEMLACYTLQALHLRAGERMVWEVHAIANQQMTSFSLFVQQLGEYHVSIEADTGDIIGVSWTHDDILEDLKTSEYGLADAPAWDAGMLAEFLPFKEALHETGERLRSGLDAAEDGVAQMADRAAHDALFREAGFSRQMFSEGVPGEGELSYEQALTIVRTLLSEEYGLSDDAFDALTKYPTFNVSDPDRPRWMFNLYDPDYDESYAVMLDGRTGEILSNEYSFGGNG